MRVHAINALSCDHSPKLQLFFSSLAIYGLSLLLSCSPSDQHEFRPKKIGTRRCDAGFLNCSSFSTHHSDNHECYGHNVGLKVS
jgi:hypothetical protein